jgi:hypothetical protein
MKAVLLQTSDAAKYAPMLAATSRTAREFCRRHELEYRHFIGIKAGQFAWHSTYNRIHMMAELLAEGHRGWVLYLDADAYVCDLDFPITEYLKENDRFAMVAVRINAAAEYWNINAGVLFVNFGHTLGQRIVSELTERFVEAAQVPQFNTDQWPDTALWLDDQSLLHTTLVKNPDWQEFIRYEPQTLMNSLHASFIRHHLRAMTPDLDERLKLIQAEVDCTLGSRMDQD